MKSAIRMLSVFISLLLMLNAVGCRAPSENEGKDGAESATAAAESVTDAAETEAEIPSITVDASYVIVLPAEADELTTRAGERMASAFREALGLELAVVTDAEPVTSHELVLGATNRAQSTADMGWHVYRVNESLHFASNDHANLYFAVEAVLDVWLSPDAGMVKDGAATMTDAFLETLNGLDTRWDHSIRILTQNMRGSDDPDGNSVQDRSVRFVQMMEEYAPDLVGTQEYSYNWQVWLGRYEKKMGGTAEDRIYGQVGCNNNGPGTKRGGMNAIWYRLDRFELLDSGTFWLSHTPEVPSVIGTRMDLRICTWAKLKDLRTGTIFVFANTHLDHADMELRYMQAEILLEQLRGIVGDLPLYLTGDFNTGSRSSVHDLVTAVLQNSHKTAWVDVSENWGTYHAYEQYGSEIDFIFHDAHSEAVRYDIVTKQYDGYISDHYGVIVDFVPVTNG